MKHISKLSIAIIFIVLGIYNHWNYEIFFSGHTIGFYAQIKLLLLSPRIIILNTLYITIGIALLIKEPPISIVLKKTTICFLLFAIHIISTPIDSSDFLLLRAIILISSITFLIYTLQLISKKNTFSSKKKNLITLLTTLFILFTIMEIVSMNIALSTFNGGAYVSRLWVKKHFNYNSDGFRGEEFKYNNKKKNIVLIGDSFLEGRGVKKIEDRFSNIIEKKLGNNYNIYNLGYSGANSKEEYTTLIKHKNIKPNIIVLCYYCNDIEYFRYIPDEKKKSSLETKAYNMIIQHSYTLNLINLIKASYSQDDSYIKHLKNMYLHRKIIVQHLNDLNQFINYSNKTNAKLIVLLIPFLQTPNQCEYCTNPIDKYFNDRHVKVINLKDEILNYKPKELVVNSFDAHASPFCHNLISKLLIKEITQ